MNESLFKNKDFTFGFVSGIALMAIVALVIVVIMLLGNVSFGATSKSPSPSVAGQVPSYTDDTAPSFVDIKVDEKNDHIRGPKNAKVTIVEYSDFQCPFCSRFHDTMKQVLAAYPNDVRWIFKHFPLDSIHPMARKAGEAAECAGEQGKFWEYADALFINQASINDALYGKLAGDLKLNVSKFNDCLSSGKMASVVDADYQEGIGYGVRGTPGNFINGTPVAGAVPFEQVKAIVDSML